MKKDFFLLLFFGLIPIHSFAEIDDLLSSLKILELQLMQLDTSLKDMAQIVSGMPPVKEDVSRIKIIDTSAMDDKEFEGWEEDLEKEIKKYTSKQFSEKLDSLDLKSLENLKKKIHAWQKDKRRDKSKNISFGIFLRRVDAEIKDKKKATPQEELKKQESEIINEISRYNSSEMIKWQVNQETYKVQDPKDPLQMYDITVNVWSNKLIDLMREIFVYYKNIDRTPSFTANNEINNFTKNQLLPDLNKVLNEEEFQEIISDPKLASKLIDFDLDAIKDHINWVRYCQMYEFLAQKVQESVSSEISNLKKLIINQQLKKIYERKIENIVNDFNGGVLTGLDKLTKALNLINSYLRVEKEFNIQGGSKVDEIKSNIEKKLSEIKSRANS